VKLVIFGNGAIGKTLRAIQDFKCIDVVSVDINEKASPDLVGDINNATFRDSLLKKGDVLADLTKDNDSVPLATWCYHNGIGYLNTDLSCPFGIEEKYHEIMEMSKEYNKNPTGTVLFSHGMNPGLVSHYFAEIMAKCNIDSKDVEEGHISEIDTQISDKMPDRDTVISTWCVTGNFTDTVDGSSLHKKDYWQERLGKINDFARDNVYWTKNPWTGKFTTYLSGNHEEVYELGGKYDIPMCFSYKSPVQFNEATKHMDRGVTFKSHIMADDVICGYNAVGVYLRKKDGTEYWCGSKLEINEARAKIRNNVKDVRMNATTMLVAAGVYAGLAYVIEHPNAGWRMPSDIDSSWIIERAKPFLGEYFVGQLV